MPSVASPFFGIEYGWSLGESGWGDPMNQNLQSLSFLVASVVEDRVGTLPLSPIDGYSAILTTDSLLYVRFSGQWVIINPFVGQEIYVKSESLSYRYSSGSWTQLLDSNTLKNDLSNTTDSLKGTGLIGYRGKTLYDHLSKICLTPENFGAIGDGVADDTTFVLSWAASPISKYKKWGVGTYKVSDRVVFNHGDQVDGAGDNSILDCSAGIGGATECVYVTGSLSALPDLTTNVTKNSNSFVFGSNPSLSLGDVILIYNPTDSSWSTWRQDYRAGEWLRVAIPTGSSITTFGLTYDAYNFADVDLYKLIGKQTSFRNFKILQPATSNAGLKISLIDGPIVENVTTGGGIYAGIYIDKCVDIKVHTRATQASSPAAGNNYGLVVGNSQGGTIDGIYYGTRHSISLGGAPGVGSVTTRGLIIKADMKNLGPIQSQDLHGNTEDIRFVGGTFTNGGVVAGKNHKWIGCTFKGQTNNGIALFMGEVKGGTFDFIGCTFESATNPNTTSHGVIDLLNFTANVTEDSHFNFSNSEFTCQAATLFPIYAGLNGTTTNVSILFNGVNIVAGAGLDRFYRLRNFGATGTFKVVSLKNITGIPSSAFSYATEEGSPVITKYKLPQQRGAANVSVTTAQSSNTAVVTYPHAYPRVPMLVAGNTNPTVGGKRVVSGYQGNTATGFLATLATADATNFTSAATVAVTWTVELEDL